MGGWRMHRSRRNWLVQVLVREVKCLDRLSKVCTDCRSWSAPQPWTLAQGWGTQMNNGVMLATCPQQGTVDCTGVLGPVWGTGDTGHPDVAVLTASQAPWARPPTSGPRPSLTRWPPRRTAASGREP